MVKGADTFLGQELSQTRVFVIPYFQRPYVWTDTNWELFWGDVRLAAESVEQEWAGKNGTSSSSTYFLGAIVTQLRPSRPKRLASSHVIDGQQRLTTLQVVLAASRRVAQSHGHPAVGGKFEHLLANGATAVDEEFPQDLAKLVPLPEDQAAFTWAIRGSDPVERPSGQHQLCEARDWLESTIDDWVSGDGVDVELRLNALHFAVEQRIQVVHIILDTSEDPQVIFEALNGRGEPLAPADLVKNLLFQTIEHEAGNLAPNIARAVAQKWSPFDSKPWRDKVTTGRIRRMYIDVFLSYWLTSATGKVVVVDHLYDTFKTWLKESGHSATDVVDRLAADGQRYLELRALQPETRLGALIDVMEATQTSTPWPLVLHLATRPDVPQAQLDIMADAVSSYTMRRAICRLTPKDYNNVFLSVLSACKDAPGERAGDVARHHLAGLDAETRRWPSDTEFLAGLLDSNLFNNVYRARLRALLIGLENVLRSDRSEDQRVFRAGERLQVEHLLPQRWDEHWPVGSDDRQARLTRQDSVHRLGNLTLLTQKLNGSVSNKPWPVKSAEIKRHALLKLTTSSVFAVPGRVTEEWSDERWASDWDEERIKRRSLWLTGLAVSAWQRPPGGPTVDFTQKLSPPSVSD